jgi:hypothetical protein
VEIGAAVHRSVQGQRPPRSDVSGGYSRHRPEFTALYAVVRDNLETLYGAISDALRSGFRSTLAGNSRPLSRLWHPVMEGLCAVPVPGVRREPDRVVPL